MMPMDFEGSISSWFGKIREGFDTFCLEAKDILPQKPVEDIVQEQLNIAAESLKKLYFDLSVFSNFMLDSEQGNSSPKCARMENKTHLGLVKSENSSPNSLSKSDSSSSEFSTSGVVGCYEEEGSDFEFHVTVLKDDNSTKRSELEEDPYEWYIPPAALEASEGLDDPAPLMASDDKQKNSRISGCKFCISAQDYAHGFSGETEFENQNLYYCHLLGQDLHDELIKHGFLSPLSGSVQSIISKQPEETEEIDSSYDKVTSSVSSVSSRTSDRILDMSICWSNCKQTWVCDHVVVAAQTNKDDAENVQDKEWEKLDEDFSDEDWEIV